MNDSSEIDIHWSFWLIGVIMATAHTLSIGIEFGIGEIIGIILMPLVVAAFLVWYSKRAENKGWIG